MNYKKWGIKISVGVILLFGIYYSVHTYANKRVVENYAKGYTKNVLGDYAKNRDGAVLGVYKAPLFQASTNLSVSTDEADLIIWVPIYGGELSYGVVINDDEAKQSYQIVTNEHLEADNTEDQVILDKKYDSIQMIKSVVKEEWGIDL